VDAATLLAESRRRSGLTQREVARRARTSAAAVCLYETGQRVPRVDTLARLVAATGSTLALSAPPQAPIDLAANGRALADLLRLADALPHASSDRIAGPALASLARRRPGP
jgi:transcriptional regulator with XRE-family HTH domain